jgi:hypothetical protein
MPIRLSHPPPAHISSIDSIVKEFQFDLRPPAFLDLIAVISSTKSAASEPPGFATKPQGHFPARDELGYVPLSPTGAELLFETFSQRYERGSIIVTSKLVYCRRNLQRKEELGAPARSNLGRARPQGSRMRRARMPGAKPGRSKEPPRTGELGLKCKAGSQLRQWRGGRRWAR